MKRKVVLGLGLAFFLCHGTRSQQKASSLEFKPAEARDNSVTFEPSVPVDWERVARANFHRFDIDHPDRAQIREHFFEPGGDASFQYEAPLPSLKAPLFYYVLADSGMAPLVPHELVGVIAYVSDEKGVRVGPPTFMGRMSARPVASQKIADAGFVLISDRSLTFKLSPVAIVQNENVPGIARHTIVNERKVGYSYKDSEGYRVPLGEHDPQFPGVKKAYVVSISGEPNKYLFVSWGPDTQCLEGCCEHSYSLIRLGKEVENLPGNAYGCDV